MQLTKEEFQTISNYEVKLLKEDLYNYVKYIEIIPMFKKILEGMEVPGAMSPTHEGSGVGINGDSISEDYAIRRSDLSGRIHIMQCAVERVEDGLSRLSYDEREIIQMKFFEHQSYEKVAANLNDITPSGLKYRVNEIILKKMIKK
ncbi:MAG: hypothetical protein ACK5L6_07490 [Anaerorhabdus sp.]|uniref:hypothetical protein n=1 Tax=Anaerorhabdus sp. TaxID=1872524 RepID=UPI003A8ACAEA